MDEVVIYPSKLKMLALALGSTLFVAFGIYGVIAPTEAARKFSWIGVIAGYIAIPFFGLCLVYGIYRFLKPSPVIIINQAGLFDNASLIGAGFLKWSEIAEVFQYLFMNQHFLAIIPVDVREAVARLPWFKRVLIRMNKGLGVAPFNIPQQTIPIPLEELWETIEKFRRANNVSADNDKQQLLPPNQTS